MATPADRSGQLGGRALQRVVHTEEEIQGRVTQMAREICAAYPPSDDLRVLGLLKGSFIFLADLVRRIERPLQVDFLVASSYGAGKVSSGEVRLLYDPEASLAGRAVVVVEDIVDSGTTLNRILPLLAARGPKSLELCVLLHKRRTRLDREPRWVGFEAAGEFLVGYGLDYSEDLRHLPYIASL
jgi:hypoxanthine phosphoribosyltransferase